MTAPDLAGPAADPADEPAPRRRSAARTAVVVVCLLLLVASAVMGTLSAVELRRDDRLQAARESAVIAARQAAVNLTAVDTQGFADDVKRVLEGATGDFKTDFERRSKTLQQVLVENQVRSQGTVLEAGVVRGDEATAVVLVVVDATVRNRAAPQGRVNVYRMQVGLEQHDGRWFVNKLEFVG